MFSLFVCVGQVIFALGGIVDLFWLMVVGRFVFGYVQTALCHRTVVTPARSTVIVDPL